MSLSILLVDDSDFNLKVASLMLKKLGHHADIARNGIEAIESLEHHNYDIVLMDIEMPEMDGLEATKIIRQKWHRSPKIIAATSLANCQDACFDAGADDFLTKPLSMEDLSESIEYNMPTQSFNEFVSIGLEEITATSDF
jgi:CheY-like chemotaxis protein